eukprot:488384-Prymnesium_polylepis.1
MSSFVQPKLVRRPSSERRRGVLVLIASSTSTSSSDSGTVRFRLSFGTILPMYSSVMIPTMAASVSTASNGS